MADDVLPKIILLQRNNGEHNTLIKRILQDWGMDILEIAHLAEIRQWEVLENIPVALAVVHEQQNTGIDFLRSVMHANNWIQRFLVSTENDSLLMARAINKAHINYFLPAPVKPDELAIYLRKAGRRYRELTRPFAKYDALTTLTQDLLADNERYRIEATTDSLTQLMNRGSFNSMLQHFWMRFVEQGTSFSIALLDIDHFKNVNDTYGHTAGDAVLRKFAELISSNHRLGSDHAFRYGGEEFAIIATNTSASDMKLYMERLLVKISKTSMRYERFDISVTFSSGICQAFNGGSPEQLISFADQALYQAKSAGRNRIFVYEP
jgi:diguanylate cyclase (GGDEF)-like protein